MPLPVLSLDANGNVALPAGLTVSTLTLTGASTVSGNQTVTGTETLNGNIAINAPLTTFADNSNIALGTANGTQFGGNANQKVGFLGATPVVQPSSTGELLGLNGNAAIAANATNMNTNGNLGNTNYGLNDIVKAMKQLGFLKQ